MMFRGRVRCIQRDVYMYNRAAEQGEKRSDTASV